MKVGGFTSDWVSVKADVPQGTKLGPLLFLITINDFKPASDTIKFVSDSSIFEVLQNTRSKLDQTLSITGEWVEHNYMELNVKKTKELRISFSDHNFDLGNQLRINNEPVRVVQKAKLFGRTISDQLKWNYHINDICSKASKRLYILRLPQRAGFVVGVW